MNRKLSLNSLRPSGAQFSDMIGRPSRMMCALLIAAFSTVWWSASVEASINDTGYIMMDGGSSVPAHYGSSSPRFIWDPGKRTFQAGNFNLSSASSGTYSFAFGHEARPWALHSMALGEFVTIGDEAHYSLALGHNVKVLGAGQARVAIGKHVTVRHLASIGIGYHAYTEGVGSISLGFRNNAYGYGAVSIGVLNDVDTGAATRGAYAIGHGLNVGREDAFVIGRFNLMGASSSENYAFVIGNGTDDETGRSDAFRVSGSGVAWAAGGFAGNGSGLTNLAGGNLHFSGSNVGIGQTSPTEKLHVDGKVLVENTGSSIGHNTISNAWLKVGTNLGMDNDEIYFNSVNGTIGTLSSHYLDFRTNKISRMRLTASGNLGIGTTSPQARLHVQGGHLRVQGGELQVYNTAHSFGRVRLISESSESEGGEIRLESSNSDSGNPVANRRNWVIDNYGGQFRVFSHSANNASNPPTLNGLEIRQIAGGGSDQSELFIRSEVVRLEHHQGDIPAGAFN